jgi:hypothetical protein
MTRGDFTRWLYRGQRPNWIARILNRAWAAVASSGVASNYLVTLEVTGRKSGRTISLPVVLAIVDGQRYLVSMLGDNVHWVQNVRAARFGRIRDLLLVYSKSEQRVFNPVYTPYTKAPVRQERARMGHPAPSPVKFIKDLARLRCSDRKF